MQLFRRFLTLLRKEYNTERKRFFIVSAVVLVFSIVAAVLVDTFVPFGTWWNMIRTVVLVPLAVSLFAFCYGVGLMLHYTKRGTDWVPYRNRFSPNWRLRIAAIVGTVCLLLVYAANNSPVFTVFSSAVGTVAIALVAFVRLTSEEIKREKLGIPDARDVRYESELKKIQAERLIATEKKQGQKKENKNNRKKYKKDGIERAQDNV